MLAAPRALFESVHHLNPRDCVVLFIFVDLCNPLGWFFVTLRKSMVFFKIC